MEIDNIDDEIHAIRAQRERDYVEVVGKRNKDNEEVLARTAAKLEDKESENKLLIEKANKFQKEREDFYNTVAVNDILQESFKEEMVIKYGYDSNAESSEDDDETDTIVTKIKVTENKKCEYCDFMGKTVGGLKTHTSRKHKEN